MFTFETRRAAQCKNDSFVRHMGKMFRLAQRLGHGKDIVLDDQNGHKVLVAGSTPVEVVVR